MKKKYIITGLLVFLFSAISIYLVLDTGKETYAVENDGITEGENGSGETYYAYFYNLNGTIYKTLSCKAEYVYPSYQCKITVPEPYQNSGYEFEGWYYNYTNMNGTFQSLIEKPGEKHTIFAASNKYYSKWGNSRCYYDDRGSKFVWTSISNPPDSYPHFAVTSKTNCENLNRGYAVLYFPNYSSKDPTIKIKLTGQTHIIGNSVTITRSGYTLTGWNTKSDGTGTTYKNGAIYSTNAKLKLYAQWKKNSTTTAPTCPSASLDGHFVYITVGSESNVYKLVANNSSITFSNIKWTMNSTYLKPLNNVSCNGKKSCTIVGQKAGTNQKISVTYDITANGKTTTGCSVSGTIKEIRAASSNPVASATCANTDVVINGPHVYVTKGRTNTWELSNESNNATIDSISWNLNPNFSNDTFSTANGVFTLKAGTVQNRTLTANYKINGSSCSAKSVSFEVRDNSSSEEEPIGCDDLTVVIKGDSILTVGTKGTYTVTESLKSSYISNPSWSISPNTDTTSSSGTTFELTPLSAGTKTITFNYSVNGNTCTAKTKRITVNEPTVEENCETTEVYISGPSNLTIGDNAEYELNTDNDGAVLSNVTWSFPDDFTIIDNSNELLTTVKANESGEKTISATYSVNGHTCSDPAVLNVNAYDNTIEVPDDPTTPEKPTNPDDDVEPAQTGEIGVIIFLALGLGMLGYSYYYTKKLKEN